MPVVRCENCGHQAARWFEKCPSCDHTEASHSEIVARLATSASFARKLGRLARITWIRYTATGVIAFVIGIFVSLPWKPEDRLAIVFLAPFVGVGLLAVAEAAFRVRTQKDERLWLTQKLHVWSAWVLLTIGYFWGAEHGQLQNVFSREQARNRDPAVFIGLGLIIWGGKLLQAGNSKRPASSA
jgi:hypothetical protein